MYPVEQEILVIDGDETARAVIEQTLLDPAGDLVRSGEIAGLSFMVELTALGGRAKLGEFAIHTLLAY